MVAVDVTTGFAPPGAHAAPYRRWRAACAPTPDALFAPLLDRARAGAPLHEREIERFLAALPAPPSAAERAALLQALAESGATVLEGAPPPASLRRAWEAFLYWKKVTALGALAAALLWHQWWLESRVPPLPAP